MAKRSDFARVPRDLYRTFDPRAVAPLLPFIEHIDRFAEPFVGQGDLVAQLQDNHGKACRWKSDIEPLGDLSFGITANRVDYKQVTQRELVHCQAVITNPPWSRDILHDAIDHFRVMKPTWFLLDADWCHTRQSAPYMKHCEMVISVGRLKWVKETTQDGKDNAAWYLFNWYESETRFVGRS